MKKTLLTMVFLVFCVTLSFSQEIIPLYEGKAPGSEDWAYKELEFTHPFMTGLMIRNVVDPTLTVFTPDKSVANGSAVIVCPGGGNVWLSYSSEGTEVAEWLSQRGFTAFVLKYRLNKTPETEEGFNQFLADMFKFMSRLNENKDSVPASMPKLPVTEYDRYYGGDDGIRALQLVRQLSEEYGIDPAKVGIMGFSAGAGITMHTILHTEPGTGPDFAAPIYGGWLGDASVPANAPPLFILAAADDPIAASSPELYKAWIAAGFSAELHIYSKGGHGFGMKKQDLPVDNWIERLGDWLKAQGYMKYRLP